MDGPELRASRTRLNIRQKALADRLGVTVEHMSKMENGRVPVGASIVRGMALVDIIEMLKDRTGETAVKVRERAEEGLKA